MPAVTINHDDDAFTRNVASRISRLTLEGKAPWLTDHAAGDAEVTYYPFIDPAPIYGGVNAVLLDLVAAERGFKDPRWIPMAMVESKGLAPKYGEKPVCLAFRNRFVEVTDTNPLDGTVATALTNSAKRISYYYVYNAEQVRGVPPLQKDRNTTLIQKKTENAIRNTSVRRASEVLKAFANQLPSHNCEAKETLAAIAKYRLACQLRLPYKAEVNVEKLKREVQKVDRESLMRAAYFAANDATIATNPEKALVVEPRRTVQRDPELARSKRTRSLEL
jgi:hypothetical protein